MARYSKHIPHPLLTGISIDYELGCSYITNALSINKTASGKIAILLEHVVSCDSIFNLIKDERAEFCVLTECKDTRMREIFKSKVFEQHPITLDSSFYAGATSLRPHITSVEPIKSFHSHNWKKDVKQLLPKMGIDLPSAAILGRAADIEFNAGNLNSTESYLEIAPSDSVKKGRWGLDLDGQRIVILICPEDLKAIKQIRENEKYSASIWASMFQRAVEEGIRKHREEEHLHKRWAKNLTKQLHDENLSTDDPDVLDAHALEYAQILMQSPLTKIMNLVVDVKDE